MCDKVGQFRQRVGNLEIQDLTGTIIVLYKLFVTAATNSTC